MGINYEEIHITQGIAFVFSFISLISSLLTLHTIRILRVWNGYILLISSMAISQIVYNIGFLLPVIPGFEVCIMWHFMYIFGGLSVSLWTLAMCYAVINVLVSVKSLDIPRTFPVMALICLGFPIIVASLTASQLIHDNEDDDRSYRYCTIRDTPFAESITDLHYWGRMIFILMNLFSLIYMVYKVRGYEKEIAHPAPVEGISSNSNSGKLIMTDRHHSVYALVSRMKYYPLSQVLCRFGSAWNEFRDFRYSNMVSATIASIFAPSLGTFYFITFLYMQPRAWQTLKAYFTGASLPPPTTEAPEIALQQAVASVFRLSEWNEGENPSDIGLSVWFTNARDTNARNTDFAIGNPIRADSVTQDYI